MKVSVCGLSWGDEAKARVVGELVKKADWSVRHSGGSNAGHTVYDDNGVKHKLHYISAGGVFGKKVAIDTGTVVNLKELSDEIGKLKSCGHFVDLYISENVHVVQSGHLEADSDGSGIGSTKKGIAYVYSDRALRKGKRVTKDDLEKFSVEATLYSGLPPISNKEDAIFESSQGIMLDIDYGCYPFVTSSSIIPSSIHRIDKFVGVFKAYTTRVGDGPPYYPDLPEIRELGQEFGTTTGRPRKCFWNDLQQIDYAISIVQPDEIVVTKLDVLKDIKDICVYDEGNLKKIGDLDTYKHFLAHRFPQIKWFSESPYGEMTEVR